MLNSQLLVTCLDTLKYRMTCFRSFLTQQLQPRHFKRSNEMNWGYRRGATQCCCQERTKQFDLRQREYERQQLLLLSKLLQLFYPFTQRLHSSLRHEFVTMWTIAYVDSLAEASRRQCCWSSAAASDVLLIVLRQSSQVSGNISLEMLLLPLYKGIRFIVK